MVLVGLFSPSFVFFFFSVAFCCEREKEERVNGGVRKTKTHRENEIRLKRERIQELESLWLLLNSANYRSFTIF